MERLIVVGNKELGRDISGEVEQFDTIVRVNRMNNWGMTGERTDLLLVDPHKDFFRLVEGPYGKYRSARRLLINRNFLTPKSFTKLMGIFDRRQMMGAHYINVQDGIAELNARFFPHGHPHVKFTNFFFMLNHMVDTMGSDHEIWFTGVDVHGRGQMFMDDPRWKRWHSEAGVHEERFLQEMLDSGCVKMLDCGQ